MQVWTVQFNTVFFHDYLSVCKLYHFKIIFNLILVSMKFQVFIFAYLIQYPCVQNTGLPFCWHSAQLFMTGL